MVRYVLSAVTIAFVLLGCSLALAADAGATNTNPEAAPTSAAGPTADSLVPATNPVQEAEQNPAGALQELIHAVKTGQWRWAASIALALLMFALARVRNYVKWFKGDRGGAILVGVLSLAGAVSVALASESPLDIKLFAGAAGVMFGAVGGVHWIKRLIWPKDADEENAAEDTTAS